MFHLTIIPGMKVKSSVSQTDRYSNLMKREFSLSERWKSRARLSLSCYSHYTFIYSITELSVNSEINAKVSVDPRARDLR